MKLPEKILVALNTYETNDSIIESVNTLLKTYNSKLVFLHVFEDNQKEDKSVEDKVNKFYDKLDGYGLKNVQRMIEYGDFINKALEIADDIDATMVLTESGTQDSNLEFLVPKIIRKTDLPVWCVKRDAPQKMEKILCPVDFSDTSRRAFSDAIRLAEDLKSELVVLTVSEPTQSVSEFISESERELNKEQFENVAQDLEEFLSGFDIKNVKITKDVKQGSAVNEIITNIQNHQAGLLVIGTHARRGVERKLLGSATEKVINDTPASFVAIKSRSLFE